MTILCDVDGVIADMLPAWLAYYNAEYGDAVRPDDVTAWDVSKFVKPECGKKVFAYLNHPDLYSTVEPIRGALAGVRLLEEVGHKVVFVTTCTGPEMVAAKVEWLERHGFLTHEGKLRDVVFLAHGTTKDIIRGDVMIDDYEVNLHAFSGRGVLLDCSYNRHDQTFTRACNWTEIVNAIAESADKTATAA
jgi:5'-nucleotidase